MHGGGRLEGEGSVGSTEGGGVGEGLLQSWDKTGGVDLEGQRVK